MLEDIRSYLKQDGFEIHLTSNYIDIINYEKLGHFDNKDITIYYKEGNIKISGEGLRISKLMNKEILIVGKINNIELR